MQLRMYFPCSLNAKKVYIQRQRLIPDDKVYPESAQTLSSKNIYSTSYNGRSMILIYSHFIGDEKKGLDNNFENYLA